MLRMAGWTGEIGRGSRSEEYDIKGLRPADGNNNTHNWAETERIVSDSKAERTRGKAMGKGKSEKFESNRRPSNERLRASSSPERPSSLGPGIHGSFSIGPPQSG